MPDLLLLLVLVLILWAEFVNGWTDAPNAIATVVSTRVLTPGQAILMATVLNTAGAFAGLAVASTIGTGIVRPDAINLIVVAAAMVSIIVWSTFAWWWGGLPTSESHALVAGLAGAGLAAAGPSVLMAAGWIKVGWGLIFSTFFGFGGGFLLMALIYRIFQRAPLGIIRRLFGKLQILSAALMAFSHGSNDGQKFIGVFTMTLLLGGVIPTFQVPFWVIWICAMMMGLGTALGGWKIMKTLGLRLTKLEPVQGFSAETAAAVAIQFASHLGIPLSTTHTISTSIIGVGASRGINAVRWGVGKDIVLAWILTFPVCGAIAWSTTKLIMYVTSR